MNRRQNYVNNKHLLEEIHKSKMSYCSVLEPSYETFDVIISSVDDITPDVILEARNNRINRLNMQAHEQSLDKWNKSKKGKRPKLSEFNVDGNLIKDTDIIARVMTYEHIPEDTERRNRRASRGANHMRCNFPPFRHYKLNDCNKWIEVLRSHWQGDFETGQFCTTHGELTKHLINMMIEMCNRYSTRSNWRGYTYIDEMKGEAIMQLYQVGLQFDESRGSNPFAYYTTTISNSFTRILNSEKKMQNIRDDVLQDSGFLPSFNRQLDDEIKQREAFDELRKAGYNEV